MSKMDNLRAMREARYAESQARSKTTAKRDGVPVAGSGADPVGVDPRGRPRPSRPEPEPEAEEALCGHRNMSGRTCTREAGHAAKSHRYS